MAPVKAGTEKAEKNNNSKDEIRPAPSERIRSEASASMRLLFCVP